MMCITAGRPFCSGASGTEACGKYARCAYAGAIFK